MALPTTYQLSLHERYKKLIGVTGSVRDLGDVVASASVVSRQQALDYQGRVVRWLAVLVDLADDPTDALRDYIREQLEDPVLNLGADYIALRDALQDLRDWVVANFPVSGDTPPETQVHTFGGDGAPVVIALTAGQLSAYKAEWATVRAQVQ